MNLRVGQTVTIERDEGTTTCKVLRTYPGGLKVDLQFLDDSAKWMTVPVSKIKAAGFGKPDRRSMSRANDRQTSIAAAEAAVGTLSDGQWKALKAIVAAGPDGLIDDEHELINELGRDTAGKRRDDLKKMGLVAGTDRKRKTRRNRWAIVWVATKEGRQVCAERLLREKEIEEQAS